MVQIANLERVSLREIWPNERNDFTPWLAENIDVLNSTIDLSLSIVEREHRTGEQLSVDLVAEDELGDLVIIENQLERSDHDHLGKLITYLTALDAKTAIWIVATPRPEHINAMSWLNASYSASFYLIKLEAVRIGESLPAPLLTLIVGSSEQNHEVGETRRELAEQNVLRLRFWTQLLARAQERTQLFANISPQARGDLSATIRAGLFYRYHIKQHDSRIDLYIDRGRGVGSENAGNENNEVFDALATARSEIEENFGEPLEWYRLEGKRACRISKQYALGGYRDEENWNEIQDAMIDGMIRLDGALRSHIESL